MVTVETGDRRFEVDELGFLLDGTRWHEDFARAMAPEVKIADGLTKDHWKVIRFIRNSYDSWGKCPLVYETCRGTRLTLRELERLFPTGYMRGACRLAGLTYREGFLSAPWQLDPDATRPRSKTTKPFKIYGVDARGFLVDPAEWDEHFAIYRAEDMRIPGGLTEEHWEVLRWLRARFEETGGVPTVYETCEAHDLDLKDLERLFPIGYQRGAVRLAGLRVR